MCVESAVDVNANLALIKAAAKEGTDLILRQKRAYDNRISLGEARALPRRKQARLALNNAGHDRITARVD